MTELLPLKAKRRIWSLRRRGRCRRMSAEEGLRRGLTIGEPTETAGHPAFYASSVSTSAATFPMGEGLDRLILNGSTIATALGIRIATPVCALARNDLSSYGSATVFPNGPAQFNPSRSDTDSCPTGHTSRHLCRFTLLHWATPNFTHPAERSVEWQAVPSYFKSGSTVPFFSNALIRSIQVPHFPQGFSPPS